MRITLTILTLRAGGAERDLCRVANFLAQEHSVTLVTLISPPEEKPFYPVDPAVQTLSLDLLRSWKENLGFWRRIHDLWNRVFCLLFYRRALQRLHPDVIISYLTKTNILTLLSSVGTKIPVIISKRFDARFLSYGWMLRILRSWTYRWADLIIAQTEEIAETLTKLKTPLMVIPNAVPPAPRHAQYADTVRTIVSIGRLTGQKGFPILLKAFAKVHQDFPQCRLLIYGEGEDRKMLQELIEHLGLAAWAQLPGITPDPLRALSEADLFVSATLYEGFPNALAEAMSVGLPVLTSDRPENCALVRDGENGCLFPVGNIDRLEQRMRELMTDAAQRRRLGQEAIKIAECFSLQRNRALWQEAIKRVTIGKRDSEEKA
ncbi:MAG: glycosyltransferase [Holosporales bacterium]|jgi:glycosyltransferase involved in cell wall biosynthesis|nr:glycosyltransferase [Holosporales bacterium]